jgi:acetyl-CoA decarbonylase/synthase complex subunit delta
MTERDQSSLSERELVKKINDMIEKYGEVVLEGVEIRAEELTLAFQPSKSASPRPSIDTKSDELFPTRLLSAEAPSLMTNFTAQIEEVQIGARRAEGGTRSTTVKVGGAKTMPFFGSENLNPNKPIFAMDVFDCPIPLAKPVKQHFGEVMSDPAEWAKKCVGFGADVVSLNLVSTDPLIKNTSPTEAAKTVEKVLQAVDVPIIVGGSGNRENDPHVLEAVAEAAHGERIVLNSVSADTDYKRVVKAARDHGHAVISYAPMDLNVQKRTNRLLLDEGLSRNQIIQDPTTAALGYGLEYTFSIMERIRLSALMGDVDLQMPMLSAASNAWGAREAWMKNTEWGQREIRGPLWETVTCLTLMMAGADIFMVSHPATIRIAKKFTETTNDGNVAEHKIVDWITALE